MTALELRRAIKAYARRADRKPLFEMMLAASADKEHKFVGGVLRAFQTLRDASDPRPHHGAPLLLDHLWLRGHPGANR